MSVVLLRSSTLESIALGIFYRACYGIAKVLRAVPSTHTDFKKEQVGARSQLFYEEIYTGLGNLPAFWDCSTILVGFTHHKTLHTP